MKNSITDPKLVRNLKAMMGKKNYWTEETLNENSTYNDLVWNYWHYYDGFPDQGFLKPNDLTSLTPIDRAIRELPNRIKNISQQRRIQEHYGK